MASYTGRAISARRQASGSIIKLEEQRANAFQKERQRECDANTKKTLRLRALRLEREEGEHEAELLEETRVTENKAMPVPPTRKPRTTSPFVALPPSECSNVT